MSELPETPHQHKIRARENWYRDVWLFLISLVVLFAIKGVYRNVSEIQEGRRDTIGINCAVSAAVVSAGKLTIVSSAEAPTPPKLEQFLKQYEYPGKEQRKFLAERAAEAYERSINAAIVHAIGVKGSEVLRPDGTLDCQKLRRLAKVGHR